MINDQDGVTAKEVSAQLCRTCAVQRQKKSPQPKDIFPIVDSACPKLS